MVGGSERTRVIMERQQSLRRLRNWSGSRPFQFAMNQVTNHAAASFENGASGWLSAHIYYFDQQDILLIEGIKPLIAEMRRQRCLQRYFFVRYFEGGPHVRLRLRGEARILQEVVKPLLESRLHTFLGRHPSRGVLANAAKRELAKLPERLRDPVSPQQDNLLRYEAYVPETARYGGLRGVEIAEKHFELSSDLALQVVETTRGKASKRLGLALNLMLASALQVGIRGDLLRLFLKLYVERTLALSGSRSPHREQLAQFGRKFEKHKRRMLDSVTALMERLSSGQIRRSPFYGVWLKGLAATALELEEAEGSGLLDLPGPRQLPFQAPESLSKFVRLLPSYLHMTNNRLGITPLNEAYLSYLGWRCLTAEGVQQPLPHGG